MNRSFSRRVASVAVSMMAVLALAACGSSTGKVAPTTTATPDTTLDTTAATTTAASVDTIPTAQTAPDPCTLVSQAQAQQVVGVPLQPAVTAGSAGDALCQYTSDPSGSTAQVEVFAGDGAKKALDIDKDTLQHDFTTLAGVGDEAYLEADNVFVRKGTVWVAVNVVALAAAPEQVQQALTALASIIAGEL